MDDEDVKEFTKVTQTALNDLNDSAMHNFILSASKDEPEPALTARLHHSTDISTPAVTPEQHSKVLHIQYPSRSDLRSSTLGQSVAAKIHELYAEEKALLAELVSPATFVNTSSRLTSELLAGIQKRTTRSMKYASTYHLAFSLLTPSAYPASWDIEEAAGKTLEPLLQALSQSSNFTVETQILPYATLPPSIQPKYAQDSGAWMLGAETLGGFVNAAEWPLSPSIGAGPTINFVLYVAPPRQRPLLVAGSNTNSWIVPQWGGIAILNPNEDTQSLSADDLEPILLNFSSQLLSLLGVPSTPAESLPLRLSSLTRLRAASFVLSASSTLGSLARVVATLPNIPIPKKVAVSVDSTIEHLKLACDALQHSDFQKALENAQQADAEAEKAFFERSMVGQVYFPDEHKVAVYLPLLGPMAVPLVLSALKEIAPYIKALRKK